MNPAADPPPASGSLAGRMTAMVTVLLAIGFVAIILTAQLAAERIVRTEVSNWLSTTASAYEALVLESLHDYEEAVASLAWDRRLHALLAAPLPSRAALVGLLEEERRRTPGVVAVLLIAPDGQVLASTSPQELERSFADHPELARARQGPHVSPPQRANARYHGTAWGPVSGPSGVPIALVAVRFDWTALMRALTGAGRIGTTGEVQVGYAAGDAVRYLLPGRDGRPIAPVPLERVPATAQAMKGRSGFTEARDYRGVDVLVAFRPVARSAWGLIVKMDAAEAFEPVARLRYALTLLGTLLLAFGAIGTWIAATRFSAPILALTRTREREASQARRLLAQVIQSMEAGVVAADRHGNTILENPAAKRWLEGVPPGVELPLARALRGERSDPVELVTQPADLGGPTTLVASAAPLIDDDGERTGAVMVLHDITARKQAENALRDSAEKLRLASKMEAVGTLSAGVAHHFNNILQVMLGHNEALGDQLEPGSPLRRSTEIVERTGQRAVQLVRQLLQFSRAHPSEPVLVHADDTVRDTLDMIRSLVPENIEIVAELPDETALVECDPVELEEAIMNLVLNARDAMPKGGRVRVVVAPASGTVRVEVHDTGPGIPPDLHQRIFDPFYTTKPVGAGTGLGLSIVYGFARRYGGTVDVRCPPSGGTVIAISLPRSSLEDSPPAHVDTSVPHPPPLPPGLRVLVVEDEEALRSLVREDIVRAGGVVVDAARADEALALVDGGFEPDVLLTDAVLPGRSGAELANELQRRRPSLKVAVITGYAPAGAIPGSPPPAWRVLRKPVRLADLRAVLAELASEPSSHGTLAPTPDEPR